MEIINKLNIQVKSGREKVGVNFTNLGTMFQDSNNKVFFNKNNPIYFDFLGYEFNGPVYHDVTEADRNRKEKTKSKGKSKEKGKFGMGGIALGVATGGLSMAVGVGRKKTKGSNKNNSKTTENEVSNSISKQVEVPSTAILNFKDSNNMKFSIMIVCDSVLELNLRNFVALEEITEKELVDSSKTVVEQLKEFKELVDLGIITQEEFDKKKYELLN
ncbi:SHOCT domain-containing protein [Vagococcus fluvialis]|uniref:SHOCT domain-containing protein n=1 Tax=Vagococcus fluvialis TaxID=2738 RepID=UPI001D0BAA02|nr:SHOCT domain-containing protein [Vagococcus fluvialis]UDM74947.1 SHOCT domain-containing protein [Vagococcus fluvialis]